MTGNGFRIVLLGLAGGEFLDTEGGVDMVRGKERALFFGETFDGTPFLGGVKYFDGDVTLECIFFEIFLC